MGWIHNIVTHAYTSFGLGFLGVLLSFAGIIISRRAEKAAKAAEKSALQTAAEVAKAAEAAEAQTIALVKTVDFVVTFTPILDATVRRARQLIDDRTACPNSSAETARQEFNTTARRTLNEMRADCSLASGVASGGKYVHQEEVGTKVKVLHDIVIEVTMHVADKNPNDFIRLNCQLIQEAVALKTSLSQHAVTVGGQGKTGKTGKTQDDEASVTLHPNQRAE